MPSALNLGRQVVVLGSLSKTYGLPGLRLGWIAANKDWLQQLRTVQQYLTLTLNAATVALGAAVLGDPGRQSAGGDCFEQIGAFSQPGQRPSKE